MKSWTMWLENRTLRIPLDQIVASRKAVLAAFLNFKDGRESRTHGPVDLWKIDDTHYQLIDGYHRFVAAIISNQKTIPFNIIGQGESDYWSITKSKDRFIYNHTMSYKDLENLSDMELLNDLEA
jgi:hypothetical protein